MKKIIILFFLILFSNILFSDTIQFIDKNNKSKINWTKKQYIAVGEAFISNDINRAKEEAKNQALSNLVLLLENTVINTNNIGKDYLEDFYIKHKIRVFLSNVSVIDFQRKTDKIIAKIVCPIYGLDSVGGILLNKCIKIERNLIYNKDEMIFPVIAKADKFPVEIKKSESDINYMIKKSDKNYTGVIFNVTRLKPSLCPKIRIENGDVVWTMSKEDVDIALSKGISYFDSLDEAKKFSGDNPLIISAINVCGEYNSDIIIKEEDAKILKSENNKSHFLNKLNVTVVCN